MIELGRGDLREKLALLDVVADIDVALVDIAAGTGEDVCRGKGRGGGRQGDGHGAVARLDRANADLGHEIGPLLRCCQRPRGVAPRNARRRKRGLRRGRGAHRGQATLPPDGAACADGPPAKSARETAPRPASASCPTKRSRSLDALLEYAMRGFAVVAPSQHGEEIGHDEQGGWRCKQQAADHGARQGRVLLLAGAADRHRQHADDHRGGRHQHRADPGVAGIDRGLERVPAGKLLLMGKRHKQD